MLKGIAVPNRWAGGDITEAETVLWLISQLDPHMKIWWRA